MHPEHTTESEAWRPIAGYEGLYSVSNRGRVRRDAPGYRSGISRTSAGRILKPTPDTGGYLNVSLYKQGARAGRTVHSLVAAAFLGPMPAGMEVNHKDGVKSHNQAGNLDYQTRPGNAGHASQHGLMPSGARNGAHTKPHRVLRGEQAGNSRLKADQVRAIRAEFAAGGTTPEELAAKYGVVPGTINFILQRKTWAHI